MILFIIISIALPLIAAVIEHSSEAEMSERHHRHHDTYVFPSAALRSIVASMIFASAVGFILSWLCYLGVFNVSLLIVPAFISSYLTVSFCLWVALRRYRVVTYADHMFIAPLVGPTVKVLYQDISSLKWMSVLRGPYNASLEVWVAGRRAAIIWSNVDIDQILMRIDRYDVLE